MLNSVLEYSSYYKNSVNENNQEAFLMWVFSNGSEKTNDVSKMAKELIKTLCKLDGDYENIKILNSINQVNAKGKRIDIKVDFDIGNENHTLIIEHKVNSSINNPFSEYINSIIIKNRIPHFVCISLRDKHDEGYRFEKEKSNEYDYCFELFVDSFIAVVEKYRKRHWLINDYFNNYIYNPDMPLLHCTGNNFQRTMKRLFLGKTIYGFSADIQNKTIDFTKNGAKVTFNKVSYREYFFTTDDTVLRAKLKKCGLFKGSKNVKTPKTNFVLKEQNYLEDIKSVENVCKKFLKIVDEIIK